MDGLTKCSAVTSLTARRVLVEDSDYPKKRFTLNKTTRGGTRTRFIRNYFYSNNVGTVRKAKICPRSYTCHLESMSTFRPSNPKVNKGGVHTYVPCPNVSSFKHLSFDGYRIIKVREQLP